jgi:LysR family transcriptional regulator, hydrogen peroxide-inducible genes activator
VNLRSLEYLVALDEHRHFRRAAEACFVSQPTLSTQIRAMERELGVELVERSPQVMMTPAGERIVEHARQILNDVDSIRAVARLSGDPEAGTLRLGIFPTLAPYLLPHVVPQVRQRFARLELLLVEEKSELLARQLREGRLDAAVLAVPIDDHGLHEELLFDEEFVVAVPAGHPLGEQRDAVSVSALAGETILLLDEGHCLRDQALSVCHLVGADERAGYRATSLETLRQMVAAGAGITLLPRLSVSAPVPQSAAIELRELSPPAPSRRLAMYWRTSSPFRSFLPRLAELFRSLPDGLVHPLTPTSPSPDPPPTLLPHPKS